MGIIKLPLEGNPNHTMGLIAHPDKITSITSTSDGKYFITAGCDESSTKEDVNTSVNIWEVDVAALEQFFFSKNLIYK